MKQPVSVKNRFRIGVAVILLFFCMAISIFEYHYLKNEAVASVYRKTEIFLAMAEATRNYVKEMLRPRLQTLVPEDRLILEGMSTSYVSREVMLRVHDRFPEFIYKRAARNPRNPVNLAGPFESRRIDWFARNPEETDWSGVIERETGAYFVRMSPVRVEAQCLSCHGTPKAAPADIRNRYGDTASYGYVEGEVVAAETLYIPMDATLIRIKEKAWGIFLIATLCLFSLFSLVNLLFQQTVISQLKELLRYFQGIREEAEEPAPLPIPPVIPGSGDEIAQLKTSFVSVADGLRRAHHELRISETKYRELFESSPDGILISEGGRLADINTAAISLFGFKDHGEACDIESVYQLFWDGRDATALFATLSRNTVVQDYAIAIVNHKGERRDALISAACRGIPAGDPPAFECSIRDITEKRRREAYLAQTDKLASIGQLAAGVAHEINNPLGVIQLYAGLIEKEVTTMPQLREDIGIIQKHTSICKDVVASLLNFSRPATPRRKAVDLHGVIDEILTVLARQAKDAGVTLIRSDADDLPPLLLDEHQMKQVLMNLILNAIQATDGGGEIRIATGVEKEHQMASLTVSDTGHGIAEKNQSRIFEPFFTTKGDEKGTGLGLAVVYGIMTRHGGTIDVTSTRGKGTAFCLRFPLSNPDTAP